MNWKPAPQFLQAARPFERTLTNANASARALPPHTKASRFRSGPFAAPASTDTRRWDRQASRIPRSEQPAAHQPALAKAEGAVHPVEGAYRAPAGSLSRTPSLWPCEWSSAEDCRPLENRVAQKAG